jgi:hypothetical protein
METVSNIREIASEGRCRIRPPEPTAHAAGGGLGRRRCRDQAEGLRTGFINDDFREIDKKFRLDPAFFSRAKNGKIFLSG